MAKGENALATGLQKHKPKLRIEARYDEYGDDGEFDKHEKKRLMDRHKALTKHLKNFDREEAADQAHQSLKREHLKSKARLMEYMDPDEMKEMADNEDEPDQEMGEGKLEKEAYDGGKGEAAASKSKKKSKAPKEDPYF